MKAVKLWGLSALAMVLGACGGNQSAGELTLDNLPVVATMEAVGQDSVCMLHLDKLGKDTLTIALSQYLEDFRLVRLDNRDEALTRGGGVCLGNYFITGGGSREACRLFDKDGDRRAEPTHLPHALECHLPAGLRPRHRCLPFLHPSAHHGAEGSVYGRCRQANGHRGHASVQRHRRGTRGVATGL